MGIAPLRDKDRGGHFYLLLRVGQRFLDQLGKSRIVDVLKERCRRKAGTDLTNLSALDEQLDLLVPLGRQPDAQVRLSRSGDYGDSRGFGRSFQGVEGVAGQTPEGRDEKAGEDGDGSRGGGHPETGELPLEPTATPRLAHPCGPRTNRRAGLRNYPCAAELRLESVSEAWGWHGCGRIPETDREPEEDRAVPSQLGSDLIAGLRTLAASGEQACMTLQRLLELIGLAAITGITHAATHP